MPSKDTEARRKAKAAAEMQSSPIGAEWAARYAEIGPPPDDAARRCEWANAIASLVIYESIVAPELRLSTDRRLILEGVRTLGMTAVKAIYEGRLRKIEAKLYGAGKVSAHDGLEDLDA